MDFHTFTVNQPVGTSASSILNVNSRSNGMVSIFRWKLPSGSGAPNRSQS